MDRKSFLRSGHTPSLLSAFLYFDTSFMIWVLLGPLIVVIGSDIPMNTAEKANLVALPTLGGSILRLVLGWLSERIGPKRTGQIGMLLTLIPLVWGWLFAGSLKELQLIALLLGVAGASFAAALPLASRWYPPHYQGLAMGIAGAGNSGTIIATMFTNRIAQHYGNWHIVFGFALIPMVLVLIAYSLMARDSPNQPEPGKLKDYAKVLKQPDTWMFCAFYGVSFGGYVGLSNFLTLFFNTQFGLDPVHAADFTTICVIAGSFFRPIGGWLADKIGGIRMLIVLYAAVGLMMACLAALPGIVIATVMLFIAMMCLGMGNGSVFQLVPQRFGKEIGLITGIVGSAGGLGGYALPKILGGLKLSTGSFAPGFLIFGGIAVCCVILVVLIQGQWKRTWMGIGGKVKADI